MSEESTLQTNSQSNEESGIGINITPSETEQVNDNPSETELVNDTPSETEVAKDANANISDVGLDLNDNLNELPTDSEETTESQTTSETEAPSITNFEEKEMSFDLPLDDNGTGVAEQHNENVNQEDSTQHISSVPDINDNDVCSDIEMTNANNPIEKDSLDDNELPLEASICDNASNKNTKIGDIISNNEEIEHNKQVEATIEKDGSSIEGNDNSGNELADSGTENDSEFLKVNDTELMQELPLDDSQPSNQRTESREELILSTDGDLDKVPEQVPELPLSNEDDDNDLGKIIPDEKENDNSSVYEDSPVKANDSEIAEILDDDKMMMDDLPMDENDTRPRNPPKRKSNVSPKSSGDEDDIVLVDDNEENIEEVKQPRQKLRRGENDGSDIGEEEEEDVEEVNYSSSDSEIMEVDAEDANDPLATPKPAKSRAGKSGDTSNGGAVKDKVEILEDSKIPKAIAPSNNDKSNAQRSGRRQSQENQKTPKKGSTKTQAHDLDTDEPDDTFVVEAPSFIVPYVYEKLPKESITEFKRSIARMEYNKAKKVLVDEEDKRRKEEDEMRRMTALPLDGEDSLDKWSESKDEEQEEKRREFDEEQERLDQENEERIMTDIKERAKKPSTNFFDSTLGNFFFELGMNIVQERVQVDLLAEQERKAKKDKSAEVMHAIMSLKSGIDQSKEKTEYFQMELKKCRFCSFRTESKAVLDHHMETPHMKGTNYRCNVCKMETRTAQEVMSHMFVEHGIRARLERAPALHQCNQCPFEDNQKGKLTKHKVACDKRFRAEKNQEPPHDWEAPAKIPKPAILPQQRYQQGKNVMPNMGALTPQQQMAQQMAARGKNSGFTPLQSAQMNLQQLANAGKRQMSQMQQQAGKRSKGNLIQPTKQTPQQLAQQMRQGNMPMGMKNGKPVYMNGQNPIPGHRPGQGKDSKSQSLNSRNANKSSKQVSITPLPSGRSGASSGRNQGTQGQPAMKPGQPQDSQKKGGFVICEICDGYIKDLEQLRNHMQWIHKVKIHPKMIYNRPPLNCQKCQFRFFTDQGLERHLLGSHGLVTASMQELANKGQDSGRCPVCGKVYQWKLLNHVAKDHQKVLKPAHLSYKCTVCTATFGQYKLFETHVYTAHSGGAKKGAANGSSSTPKASAPAKSTPAKAPVNIEDEITID